MAQRIAVVISDIHFNVNTLTLASKSLQAAVTKAESLDVPLIIAGDLNDTKAIIRAEVANAIISILKPCKVTVYILEGNHDKINEKGIGHGLNYLAPYAHIIDSVSCIDDLDLWCVPYQNNSVALKSILTTIPVGSKIIMHQGFLGAQMGDYVQDKTSISTDLVKDFTVISGHYHRHQTLGTVTYIGSPYTITFGEANDGPKGFLVLNKDGSFEREILILRKHIIVERDWDNIFPESNINPEDLLWLKLKGPLSELQKVDKSKIGKTTIGHSNYKLDLIPNDSKELEIKPEKMTDGEIFDTIIDTMADTDGRKQYLRRLWREITSV